MYNAYTWSLLRRSKYEFYGDVKKTCPKHTTCMIRWRRNYKMFNFSKK